LLTLRNADLSTLYAIYPDLMPAPAYFTVLLSAKGEVRKANLQLNAAGDLTQEIVHKYMRRKEAPEMLASLEDPATAGTFTLFGYRKGKADTENRSTFPDELGGDAFFGDVLIVYSPRGYDWKKPAILTPEKWASFVGGAGAGAGAGASAAAVAAKHPVSKKPKKPSAIIGDDSDEEEEDDEKEEEEEKEDEELEEVPEEEKEDGEEDVDSVVEEEEEEEEAEEDAEDEEVFGGEDEEEIVPEPQAATKRKKGKKAAAAAAANPKIDLTAYKEEIPLDTPASSHPLRQWCRKNLEFLEENFDTEDVDALELAIFAAAAESARRHYIPRSWKAIAFGDLYKQTARNVLWNIHPQSTVKNERLLTRCEEGEFPLSAIAAMTAYEMFPENWKELADKQLIREQKILEGNKRRATDRFKCNRCGKRECTYYELQTRSADEPMTKFIMCLNCGKQWKE
jgi:transcription elongation factor S-II